jgi:alpha-1,3/alpha-1,6-mannosyltransferase
MPARATSVGFLRARMGIGGGERLVASAAVALKQRGYTVTLYVPDAGSVTQLPELAEHEIPFNRQGAFIPSSIAGHLRVPLAVTRSAYAGWRMSHASAPDIVFSDVVAHVLPLVKRLTGAPILYFCHYPDLLLTPDGGRDSPAYRVYRRPLDWLEARGIAVADLVVANSRFTAGAVRTTFPSLPQERLVVLYPGVEVPAELPGPPPDTGEIVILSVNRFDPRKNLPLAVDALRTLRGHVTPELFSRVRLVFAGYRDTRMPESAALVSDLRRRVEEVGLTDHVRFAFNPGEQERRALLSASRCVIYTPVAEHFGYGPIEAMAMGRTVIAVNRGGPAETVLHGETGFLCEPTADAFANALAPVVSDRQLAATLGQQGHAHVARRFSLDAFGDNLDAIVQRLILKRRTRPGDN